MSKPTLKILILSLIVPLCGVLPLHASDSASLKILDSHGLVRGSGVVQSATVEVQIVSPSPNAKITLSNVDGFAPEREAEFINSGVFTFKSVPPGTWKIVGDGATVESVKLTPD